MPKPVGFKLAFEQTYIKPENRDISFVARAPRAAFRTPLGFKLAFEQHILNPIFAIFPLCARAAHLPRKNRRQPNS
jgi:hypothetical protein